MASTAISEISAAIIRKGHPLTKYVALAAATYIPGDWVYYNAAFECTAAITTTSILMKAFLLDFEPRISTTKVRKDIDDAIAIENAPVVWGGATGPMIVAATCENPAATKFKGQLMGISSTAGDIEFCSDGDDPPGGVTTSTNTIIWADLVTGDTVGKFLLY